MGFIPECEKLLRDLFSLYLLSDCTFIQTRQRNYYLIGADTYDYDLGLCAFKLLVLVA